MPGGGWVREVCTCAHIQSLQSCLTLCNPMDCSPFVPVEFSRHEYWSGLPFPTPGDTPDPGMEPTSLASPVLAGRFFTTAPPGEPIYVCPTAIAPIY